MAVWVFNYRSKPTHHTTGVFLSLKIKKTMQNKNSKLKETLNLERALSKFWRWKTRVRNKWFLSSLLRSSFALKKASCSFEESYKNDLYSQIGHPLGPAVSKNQWQEVYGPFHSAVTTRGTWGLHYTYRCVWGRVALLFIAVQVKVQELRICLNKLFMCPKYAGH